MTENMDAKFANGLLGHRVEGITQRDSQTIQGVYVGTIMDLDGIAKDRIMDDDGNLVEAILKRVILPVNEPSRPAEPDYSIEYKADVERLKSEVLVGAGLVDFHAIYDTIDLRCKWLIAATPDGNSRIKFDNTGVYMVHSNGEPRSDRRIPLNEWIKASLASKDSAQTYMDGYIAGQESERFKQKEGNEPQKPANTYDWNNFDDVMRLQGFLQNVGYKVSMTDDDKMIADKDFNRIKIDETGVYLIARLPEDQRAGFVYDAHNGITLPLNEWVKNPTIEALMPPKDN